MMGHKYLTKGLLVFLTLLCVLFAFPSQTSAQIAPVIGIKNAGQVMQSALLGGRNAKSIQWLPDSKRLAVGSTTGLWVYALDTPDAQPNLIPALNGPIVLSKDAKWLLSRNKQTYQVIDFETGQTRLSGFANGDITSLEISPDGSRLVVASWSLSIWDITKQQQVAQFDVVHYAHTQFTEDGLQLVAAAQDGVHVYDTQTWQPRTTIPSGGWSHLLLPAADLFIGRVLNVVELWNTKSRIRFIESATHHEEYNDLALSPDRTTIATTTANKASTVVLWTLKTGNRRLLIGNTGRIVRLAYSADGKTLLTLTDAGEVRLWDTVSLKEVLHLNTESAVILDAQLSPDGRFIATFDDQSDVRVWDAQNGQPISVWADQTKPLTTLAVSKDGTQIAAGSLFSEVPFWARRSYSGGYSSNVYVWDTPTLTRKAVLTRNAGIIRRVAFNPNGRLLAAGVGDGSIRLWDTQTYWLRDVWYDEVYSGALQIAFSTSGKLLAATNFPSRLSYSSQDQVPVKIRLWNVERGEPLFGANAAIVGGQRGVQRMVFSPDDSALAVAYGARSCTDESSDFASSQQINVWQISNAALPTEPIVILTVKPNEVVYDIAYSSDGSRLASASGEAVHVWDTRTWQQVIVMENSWSVCSVAYSPDGNVLASGSRDGIITLWDAHTGDPLATLRGHADLITGLVFNPDGRTLYSSSLDGSIRLWRVKTPAQ